MLGMPPGSQSSQSLPIVAMDLMQVGLSSHLPGMSQALETDIDAWRACKDNTNMLPSTVAIEFERLQNCADSWTKAQTPLLGKYLLNHGGFQRARSTQSAAVIASAICTQVHQEAHGESNDATTHGGSAETEQVSPAANGASTVEVVIKVFLCSFAQFDREKELWQNKEAAKEMGAIVEFGGDTASEVVSSALHPRGHTRVLGSIAKEQSMQLPTECSQGLCSQVPCIVMGKGMSVLEWMRVQRPSVADALEMLCAVTESLERVHSMGITHRNIKPMNLLWLPSQKKWTLCDFGCSSRIGADPLVPLLA